MAAPAPMGPTSRYIIDTIRTPSGSPYSSESRTAKTFAINDTLFTQIAADELHELPFLLRATVEQYDTHCTETGKLPNVDYITNQVVLAFFRQTGQIMSRTDAQALKSVIKTRLHTDSRSDFEGQLASEIRKNKGKIVVANKGLNRELNKHFGSIRTAAAGSAKFTSATKSYTDTIDKFNKKNNSIKKQILQYHSILARFGSDINVSTTITFPVKEITMHLQNAIARKDGNSIQFFLDAFKQIEVTPGQPFYDQIIYKLDREVADSAQTILDAIDLDQDAMDQLSTALATFA
ncbi:MAG: hypothetical protein P0S95_01110 [Rhabdochlamydiaceae bacterium]|nr:hypothetical protein [Candidatus Amphrikana amoebophyrae]